jgi:hypothetical protein
MLLSRDAENDLELSASTSDVEIEATFLSTWNSFESEIERDSSSRWNPFMK